MTTTVLAFIPSPSQGVWHIGFIPIRAYALCIIAGIVAALVLGDRRWVARGGEPGVIYDIALWAVPFGLIGGRLYHLMTDWQKYFGADGAGFLAALRIWDGGLGIWGAVALGGVGAWIACRRRGIPLPAFGDAVAPGIILAQAIGRLGNYFNQELYGRVTDLPWGLEIYQRLDPSGVISPNSLEGVSTGQVYSVVHPTFLYELIWNLLIFAVLMWADRRFTLGHGRLFALYVAGYCVGRFWVELMRNDTATLIAGIRVNSFTSTFVFIGAVVYIMVAPKGREEPKTLRGNDVDESRIDSIGEELVAVAATSGVVAAAKVAGDDDQEETTASESTISAPVDDDADESEFTGGADVESEAAAEAEDLTARVETAPSEDIAEAEAFAEAGETADEEREAGMGSVEGEQAIEAEVSAPEAHEAAVDGVERAEALAEDVAAEPESDAADDLAVEQPAVGSAAEPTAEPAESDVAAAVGAEEPTGESPATPVDLTGHVETPPTEVIEEGGAVQEPREAGMGSVEGDQAIEAAVSAPEAHEAAVDGVERAQSLAEDVAAEPQQDVADEVAVEEPAAEAAEDSAAAPEDGLGSVDGAEVEAAEADVAEVHEAAVEGTESAEATAAEVSAEAKPRVTPAKPVETSRRRWWRRN